MKCFLKVFVGILTVLISVDTVFAQTERGDKEFSNSVSFMSVKYEHADEYMWVLNLATRLGFFVTKNIEVEPEIQFTKYKEEDAGVFFSGNIAYNFSLTSQEGRLVPFVLGGFGFSNATMIAPNIPYTSWEDKNWTVLNLGGGLKIFVPKPIALRLEYRFQNWFGNPNYTYHNIFFGISVFF